MSRERSPLRAIKTSTFVRVVLLFFIGLSVYLLLRDPIHKSSIQRTPNTRINMLYDSWHECIMKNISGMFQDPKQMWGNFWRGVQLCESLPGLKQIAMTPLPNSDETKYHILAKEQTADCVVVTLGVGHDTRSEQQLRKLAPNCRFFGADPIPEINEKLYTEFGKFFPFAVGSFMGSSVAQILNNNGTYEPRTVVHIDLVHFLLSFVNESFVDDLWLDAEGAEYGLFPQISSGGLLDQAGITLCQFNIEVHLPSEEQKALFTRFIWQTLTDRRYAFFRIVQGNHIRLFFVNFEDRRCVEKYLVKFFHKKADSAEERERSHGIS